jgi:hypothetical protein
MFGIQIKNRFLDLLPKTVLSFELRNPAYLGEDIDVIQESFMFTISVPMTAQNKRLLVNPNRLDNAAFFLSDEECCVYCQGIEVFRGLITVRSATSQTAEVFVKVNTISLLKSKSLSQLNHDTVNLSAFNAIGYLGGSCLSPELRDFVCFPVWNPDYYQADDFPFRNSNYQNLWGSDPTQDSVLKIKDKSPVTPFLKVNYLLRKMSQTTGFVLSNNWQVTRELEGLCSYNNRSIVSWNGEGTSYTIDPILDFKNHVSKAKSSEYLKNLARLFNLGVYVNFFNNSLDITPNNTILQQSPRHDWTRRVISDHTKTESLNFPSRFGFANTPSVLPNISKLTRYPNDATLANSPEGLYLNDINNRYYHKPNDIQSELIAVELDNYVKISEDEKNAFNSPLGTLPNSRVFMNTYGVVSAPAIRQKGAYKIQNGEQSEAAFEDRLVFYRGMTDFRDNLGNINHYSGYFYPLASSEDTTVTGYRIKTGWDSSIVPASQLPPQYVPDEVQHTLNWNGEKGLYNRSWNEWQNMLMLKRDVKLTLGLSIKEIRDFSFQNKIRIANREYLVRRLRVTLTESGLAPTEAELITV